MKRYIDADELDRFIDVSTRDPRHENIGFNISYLKKCLREMETSDVTEVVRCKYCKYWKTVGASVAKFCTCIVNTEVMKDEDDYCSLGERKYNED